MFEDFLFFSSGSVEQNHCSHLGFSIRTILACFDPEQVSAQSDLWFEKRCRKLIFKMAAVVAILDISIGPFSYFVSHEHANAQHQVSIQLDYRGDVQNMNSQYFPR